MKKKKKKKSPAHAEFWIPALPGKFTGWVSNREGYGVAAFLLFYQLIFLLVSLIPVLKNSLCTFNCYSVWLMRRRGQLPPQQACAETQLKRQWL